MPFGIFEPCARLQPFVKHLVVSEATEVQTYPVLPDTALVMGFQYRGRLSHVGEKETQLLSTAGITGLMDSHRLFRNTAFTGTVLVIFREAGAAHFMTQPLHELFDQSISLELIFGAQAMRILEEQLSEAVTNLQRVQVIENFLLEHLLARQPDLLVLEAIAHIHRSQGTLRIRELARTLHTSQSPLEKRFRGVTGASPKKFANIVRARSMLEALQQGHLRSVDYLSSFYDQAHFIKTFKRFTGSAPEAFLRKGK